jgi:4-amino-4-deoxy-L-arabinose transferase-like glycosyltransferase
VTRHSRVASSSVVAGLICGAFGLRFLAGMVRYQGISWWDSGYSDYSAIAQNIILRHEFRLGPALAPRPPLYPLLLSGELAVGGMSNVLPIFVQAAIGAGTVLLVFLLARSLFDRPVATLAVLVVAAYPYYVAHDASPQETVLFTFLTTGAVYALLTAGRSGSLGSHVLAGCWLGLDVLCREVIVPFVPLAVGWLVCYPKAVSRRGAVARAAVTLVATLLVVAPWLVRNATIYGRPVLSTGVGFGLGYRMWVGFNESTLAYYPWDSIDRSTALALERLSPADHAELDRLDELSADGWFMRRALSFIEAHPAQAGKYALMKVVAAFGPVLSPATGPWWRVGFHAVSYAPLVLLAVVGGVLARGRSRELSLVYLLAASFLPAAILAHAHTSHRSYLDVYVAILASYAVVTGWRRRQRLTPVHALDADAC